MVRLAVSSIRARLASYAGSFLAVALAVAIIGACLTLFLAASSGPPGGDRYRAAAYVLVAEQRLGGALALVGMDHLPERRTLPVTLATELGRVEGVERAVADVAFPAQLPGSIPGIGRAWDAAALTPFTLTAGKPPQSADEVVLPADWEVQVGAEVTVLTPKGALPVTVSGLARPPADATVAPTVFFADKEAVRQADGKASAIAVFGSQGLTQALSQTARDARVLSGQAKAEADPSPEAAGFQLLSIALITLGGNAAFVAVFVIASTFAFSVLQRQRDIALLRAIGATPRQVQRMIAVEALVISLLGAAAGTALAYPLTTLMEDFLRARGVIPAAFHATPSALPLAVAAGAGILVTQLAIWAAARRAARTRAIEALREATLSKRPVTMPKLLIGLALIAGAAVLLVVAIVQGGATGSGSAFLVGLLLMVAAALLGPLAVRPLASGLGAPLERMTHATGLLARANSRGALRRVAGGAVPLMLALTIAGILLSTQATAGQATTEEAAARVTAPYVLLPDGTPGLPVAAEQAAEGAGTMPTSVFVGSGEDIEPSPALGVPTSLTSFFQIETIHGDLARLTGATVSLASELAAGHTLGTPVKLTLGDGTQVTLELVAVHEAGLGLAGVLLPRDLVAAHSATGLLDTVYANAPLDYPGVRSLPRAEWARGLETGDTFSGAFAALLVVVCVAYTAISIVNTLVTATFERRREFALLRLLGLTRAQVLRMASWEAAITVLFGVLTGTAIVAVALAGVALSLDRLLPVVDVPLYAGLAGLCALLGWAAMLVPALAVLKLSPVHAVAGRE